MIVLAKKWVVFDVEEALVFDKMFIYGTLEFEYQDKPNTTTPYNFNLTATHIVINNGRMIVGWPDNPLRGETHIILRGDHYTEDMPLPDGPNLGSKAIGDNCIFLAVISYVLTGLDRCKIKMIVLIAFILNTSGVFGGLDMHGVERAITWTQLSKTATKGSDTLELADPVDWPIGSRIVIAPTSFSAWQTEIFEITDISNDNTTLTLNGALQHNHLGKDCDQMIPS